MRIEYSFPSVFYDEDTMRAANDLIHTFALEEFFKAEINWNEYYGEISAPCIVLKDRALLPKFAEYMSDWLKLFSEAYRHIGLPKDPEVVYIAFDFGKMILTCDDPVKMVLTIRDDWSHKLIVKGSMKNITENVFISDGVYYSKTRPDIKVRFNQADRWNVTVSNVTIRTQTKQEMIELLDRLSTGEPYTIIL